MRSLAWALPLVFLLPLPAEADWAWNKKQRKQIAAMEKQVTAGPEFAFTLEGEHWKVETGVSARFTAELTLFMDLFHGSFNDLMSGLDAQPIVKQKPTVQVLGSQADYEAKHTKSSRGYYSYKWDANGVWTTFHLYTFIKHPKEREFSRFYHPILLHEGTHVLMRGLLGKAANPKWFDEGVATYFQFWDLNKSVKANRKTRYSRSLYLKHLSGAVRKDGLPKLQKVLDLGPLGWNPDNMGPIADKHYAFGESLIDCMLTSKKGAEFFVQTFERLRSAEKPTLSPDEVQRFEKVWHKHLRKVLRLR